MSFRVKTILGISIIQAVLLGILIFNVLNYLQDSNENQIIQRAQTTAKLFANSVTDAVIAVDLATLESVIESVMQDSNLVYAQVLDVENNILAEQVLDNFKPSDFMADGDIASIHDGIFDTEKLIGIGEIDYGKVRIGFDIKYLEKLIEDAKRHSISIAVILLLLVAMFSFFLGLYLTNRLGQLSKASEKVASGDYGYQVNVTGNDEIAKTIKAFNLMSSKIKEQIDLVHEKNEELTVAKNLAEASSRAKTEFLSIMSHELKTPLNSIIGFSELMESASNLNDEQRDFLHEIDASGQKLSELVSAILELAEIDETEELYTLEVDLHSLINQSVSKIESLCREKNVDIKVLVDQDISIYTDHQRLSKCIDHLVSNAIKYNVENGSVEISVSQNDFVEISVKDTGHGLSDSDSEKIFDAFERLKFGKEGSISGAGVGLTITKKLIESLGGEIFVKSELGKGSVFTLKLPKQLSLKA